MYTVIAYHRETLGGCQVFYFRVENAEQRARDKRVDLLVKLPAEYIVEINQEEEQ